MTEETIEEIKGEMIEQGKRIEQNFNIMIKI